MEGFKARSGRYRAIWGMVRSLKGSGGGVIAKPGVKDSGKSGQAGSVLSRHGQRTLWKEN